jgi:hypothetical protein
VTAEKQHKTYGTLMCVAVILLLAAQGGLQYIFQQTSEELVSVSTSLAADNRTLKSQQSLNEKYSAFETLLTGSQSGADRKFPINGRELFTALAGVLKNYSVEFTSSSDNAGVQPGADFTLYISLSGQYYNVVKALAAIRESNYIMKISELALNAEGDGNVRGTMSIMSTSQAQS